MFMSIKSNINLYIYVKKHMMDIYSSLIDIDVKMTHNVAINLYIIFF